MYRIIIQHAGDKSLVPASSQLRLWAKSALKSQVDSGEVTLRVVGEAEMTELNSTYRHKNGPTNVLSFPSDLPDDIKLSLPFLGDIVLCSEVINREACDQQKSQEAHWAHMIVHGIFHLLGHDHVIEEDAEQMERLEINILQTLGFANPYDMTGENLRPHD